ncbi:potassium channel family protein [Clostridium carnis]
MSKRATYDIFSAGLALMAAIILIIDITIEMPPTVKESFYYIDLIIWFIFLLDYIVRLIFSDNRFIFIINNFLDLAIIIPTNIYFKAFLYLGINDFLNAVLLFKICKLIRLMCLVAKFRKNIKKVSKINKFNYMIILTTIVIIMGAVVISLLENMSLGDALWWSFVTFTTVGYGDILLTTSVGRIVAVLLMIFGIGFIGITTSTLAAYIINDGKMIQKSDFREETIENIKYKLDRLDYLSDEELDAMYKTLKTLKKDKKT